jgi:hypothetical protein
MGKFNYTPDIDKIVNGFATMMNRGITSMDTLTAPMLFEYETEKYIYSVDINLLVNGIAYDIKKTADDGDTEYLPGDKTKLLICLIDGIQVRNNKLIMDKAKFSDSNYNHFDRYTFKKKYGANRQKLPDALVQAIIKADKEVKIGLNRIGSNIKRYSDIVEVAADKILYVLMNGHTGSAVIYQNKDKTSVVEAVIKEDMMGNRILDYVMRSIDCNGAVKRIDGIQVNNGNLDTHRTRSVAFTNKFPESIASLMNMREISEENIELTDEIKNAILRFDKIIHSKVKSK